MKKPPIRIATLGILGACLALAGLAACRPAADPAPEQSVAVKPGVLNNPWMDGEHWGMPPEEVAAEHSGAPVLQSPSSDYYMTELDGRLVLAQYIFSPPTADAPRGLIRKIVHLASPKRQRFLPLLSGPDAQAAFRSIHARMEALHGPAPIEESPMAVSELYRPTRWDNIANFHRQRAAHQRSLRTAAI